MSVYYAWVCPAKKQRLEGFAGESIKRPYYPGTLKALGLLCAYGSWRGNLVMLIDDTSESSELWHVSRDWSSADPEASQLMNDHCACGNKPHIPSCPKYGVY